ncbi:hypothetical protein [Methanobrevibacter cuticularis]|nr:hypothetical protein [Methanobrevibacter cuticularis]
MVVNSTNISTSFIVSELRIGYTCILTICKYSTTKNSCINARS